MYISLYFFKFDILLPVHKGHGKPRNNRDAYRGITLMPILNKVLESIVWQRFNPWLIGNVSQVSSNMSAIRGAIAPYYLLCYRKLYTHIVSKGVKCGHASLIVKRHSIRYGGMDFYSNYTN